MAIVITEILGGDAISGSRYTINANFNALKAEVESIESAFGLGLTSGNIDISTATGGDLKAKTGAFNSLALPASVTPNITLTGSTGAIVSSTLVANTSITTPAVNVSLGGAINNQGTLTQDGVSTFNDIVYMNGGQTWARQDIGSASSHTVANSDRVIVFEVTASPGSMTLTPDPGLVDKHVVTIVKRGSGACFLDPANILGFGLGSIDFSSDSYKSSITLQWSSGDAKWIILSSSNMTIS